MRSVFHFLFPYHDCFCVQARSTHRIFNKKLTAINVLRKVLRNSSLYDKQNFQKMYYDIFLPPQKFYQTSFIYIKVLAYKCRESQPKKKKKNSINCRTKIQNQPIKCYK